MYVPGHKFVIDDVVYSTVNSSYFYVIKWDPTLLNDVNIQTINKETFGSDPASRGWLVGSKWEYDDTNHNMKNV